MSRLPLYSLALSLSCLTLVGAVRNETEECSPGKRYDRASVRHIEGGGIGYNQGYTTFEAFLNSGPGHWPVMPFLDIRGLSSAMGNGPRMPVSA